MLDQAWGCTLQGETSVEMVAFETKMPLPVSVGGPTRRIA